MSGIAMVATEHLLKSTQPSIYVMPFRLYVFNSLMTSEYVSKGMNIELPLSPVQYPLVLGV